MIMIISINIISSTITIIIIIIRRRLWQIKTGVESTFVPPEKKNL